MIKTREVAQFESNNGTAIPAQRQIELLEQNDRIINLLEYVADALYRAERRSMPANPRPLAADPPLPPRSRA